MVATLDQVFREEWGRVLATLIGLLGDFDLAEEAAQEAFAIAADRWPPDGVPDHPHAWLIDGSEPSHGPHPPRSNARHQIRRGEQLPVFVWTIDLKGTETLITPATCHSRIGPCTDHARSRGLEHARDPFQRPGC